MKLIKFALIPAIILTVASCGKNNATDSTSKLILKPATTEVSGDFDECFTVVDRNYKVIKTGLRRKITVELQRTDKPLPFNSEGKKIDTYGVSGVYDFIHVGFGIEFLDEDGNIIQKESPEHSNSSATGLMKLKDGKTGSIAFYVPDNNTITSFRISSSFKDDNPGKKSGKLRSGKIPASGNIEVFNYLSDKYLSPEDLTSYSSSELRILRNAIYALHNYSFNDPQLQNFFNNFKGYTPLTKNVNLNQIEQYNVNLIKRYE